MLPQNGSSYLGSTVLNNATCPVLEEIIYLGRPRGGASSFVGCIDRVIVGGQFLPLLLPSERGVSISTCELRPPAQNVRETSTGASLLGAGSFISFGNIPATENQFNFTILFRTFSSFGNLYAGFGPHQYFVLGLQEGKLEIHLATSIYNNPLLLTSNFTYNSGLLHNVSVQYFNESLIIYLDDTENISSLVSNVIGNSFLPFDRVSIPSLFD